MVEKNGATKEEEVNQKRKEAGLRYKDKRGKIY